MSLPVCVMVCLAGAIEPAAFREANLAYEAGDYAAAVAGYERLLAGGAAEPVVFYNLGNAYYRQGRVGAAIANYERALRLSPNMENAQHNLAQAVSKTDRRLPRPAPPRWERILLFWDDAFSPGFTWKGGLLAWCLTWLALGLRAWRPLPHLRTVAVACGVAAAALGLSAVAKTRPSQLAVAAVERVSAHYGSSETETVRFELHEGDRVRVDQREGDWVRVALEDGDRGWAHLSGLLLVGPPYEPPREPVPSGGSETVP